ncbi:hypothetical protein C8Q70DRAFT_1051313 [Cubamyces menziesii]|nr:hypothetical protein C8Q70DRAFT_1051313 [Cubamyces menziesii]
MTPPASSPHPALSNPDIVHSIFAQLSPLPPTLAALWRGDELLETVRSPEVVLLRTTLKKAALACRAFAGPASDALWSVLHIGFAPLFYTFKGFKIIVEEDPQVSHYGDLFGSPYTVHHVSVLIQSCSGPYRILTKFVAFQVLEGEVHADDWERWELCARRVRCFVYADYLGWQYEDPFLSILLTRARDITRPIFPNLLAFSARESQGIAQRRVLLRALAHSPGLSAVLFRQHLPGPFLGTLVDDIAMLLEGQEATGSCLRHLSIKSSYQAIHVVLPLKWFRRLRTVVVSPASAPLYRYLLPQLGALKELETLVVAIDDDPSSVVRLAEKRMAGLDKYPPGGDANSDAYKLRGGFCALRRLSVDGMHSDIEELLRKINSTVLQDIAIFSVQDTNSDIVALVQPLGAERISTSLRKLYLSLTTEFPLVASGADTIHVAFADIFRSLRHLRALENLEVMSWNRVLSISDDDVRDMATSWPLLRRLTITSDSKDNYRTHDMWTPYAPHISRPSLLAVTSLAEGCRDLISVSMDVADMSDSELETLETHAAAAGIEPQTRLMHLVVARDEHFMRLSLPDIDRLAGALRRLFPSLEGPGESSNDWRTRMRPLKHWWTEEQRQTAAYRLMEKFNE